ncbi:hypothetical protein NDR87_20395 [Nocardia sp. CDC159]|uniref:Uncharacterized protein n=1 Tax=Nocardia pulmonis TaxID=2951408 RepID=A0A9X2J0U4_9NOCA|nr:MULTISPECIES: hypothetical protein [Nocardia]MCM6776306.1 hypothetical protein [Nocardia pulmonis]MCM6788730.1 hypothetical protein [Nocardia sp. CDC159]
MGSRTIAGGIRLAVLGAGSVAMVLVSVVSAGAAFARSDHAHAAPAFVAEEPSGETDEFDDESDLEVVDADAEVQKALCNERKFSDEGAVRWWDIYGWSVKEYRGSKPYREAAPRVFIGDHKPPMGVGPAAVYRHYIRTLCDKPAVQKEWVAALKDFDEQIPSTLKPGCEMEAGIVAFNMRKLEAQVKVLVDEKKMPFKMAANIIGPDELRAWRKLSAEEKEQFFVEPSTCNFEE